ncbi:MAG: Cell division coordinator CpoB [Calditrichaeota bacterium]|nr:Cell division coordinator CpoB [Calditrichota bacterium]
MKQSIHSSRIRAPILAALAALFLVTPALARGSYETRYEEALGLYREGRLSTAIQQFRALIEENPRHSLADNCQYWIGEAYFRLRRYEQAIVEFDRTLTYRNTNKREDALYKLASCHERLGKAEAARELYLRLLAEFPNTRHASYVVKKLDMLGS